MKIALDVLTVDQVIGLNLRAIKDAHRRDPKCKQQHLLSKSGELSSCVDSIFMQLHGVSG